MKNKTLNKIKRDTQIIIISVIVLTIVTLNVSYSAFFSVETQSAIQEFQTGDLNVTVESPKIAASSLYPADTKNLPDNKTASVNGGDYSTLTLTNNGSLDADFSVSLSVDNEEITKNSKNTTDSVNLQYIYIGILGPNNEWIPFTGSNQEEKFYTSITSLTPSNADVENKEYPILRDIVKTQKSGTASEVPNAESNKKTYKIYVWLSPDTPTSEIDKLVYLKLNVKSTTIDTATPEQTPVGGTTEVQD